MQGDFHYDDLNNIINALSDEDKKVVVDALPIKSLITRVNEFPYEVLRDEVDRRYKDMESQIEIVKGVFHSPQDNTRP